MTHSLALTHSNQPEISIKQEKLTIVEHLVHGHYTIGIFNNVVHKFLSCVVTVSKFRSFVCEKEPLSLQKLQGSSKLYVLIFCNTVSIIAEISFA